MAELDDSQLQNPLMTNQVSYALCPEHSTEELLQEHGEAYRDRVADYEQGEVQQD